ncbi:MAG: hypothetical protein HY706_11870 [Candidatus Hydrogenedentes bacterium]|nr:hypothetical protein [Candidatus Hydrogenedentota bacterium]
MNETKSRGSYPGLAVEVVILMALIGLSARLCYAAANYDVFVVKTSTDENSPLEKLVIGQVKTDGLDLREVLLPERAWVPGGWVLGGYFWYVDLQGGKRILTSLDLTTGKAQAVFEGFREGARLDDEFLYLVPDPDATLLKARNLRSDKERNIAQLAVGIEALDVNFIESPRRDRLAFLAWTAEKNPDHLENRGSMTSRLFFIVDRLQGTVRKIIPASPLMMPFGEPQSKLPFAWYDEDHLLLLRAANCPPSDSPCLAIALLDLKTSQVQDLFSPDQIRFPGTEHQPLEMEVILFRNAISQAINLAVWFGRRERVTLAEKCYTVDVQGRKLVPEESLGGPYRYVTREPSEHEKRVLLRRPGTLYSGDTVIGYETGMAYVGPAWWVSPDGTRIVWQQAGPTLEELRTRSKGSPLTSEEFEKYRLLYHDSKTGKIHQVINHLGNVITWCAHEDLQPF